VSSVYTEPEPNLPVDEPDEAPQFRRVLDLACASRKIVPTMPERRDSFSRIAE
jgi:hypothetical protein